MELEQPDQTLILEINTTSNGIYQNKPNKTLN